jgi:hypothetical protein
VGFEPTTPAGEQPQTYTLDRAAIGTGKLYYDSSIIIDRNIRTNSQNMAVLGKIIKEAYLIDAAIPNSHNLHSIITEKLQMYTDLKEFFTRIWKLRTAYIISLVLSTKGNIPNKLHESLNPLYLRSSLYIIMQKAV